MNIDNSSGYIYCFSNVSMPGIYKIGMTERTPEKRLSDANNCDTWRPPTPYKIEFAKKVMQPRLQENILHKILTEFGARINEKREFFSISIDKIKEQFDQINGEDWVPHSENIAETILEKPATTSVVNNSTNSRKIKHNKFINFKCKFCKIETNNKKDFNKHLLTAKHLRQSQITPLGNHSLQADKNKFLCQKCLKQYNSRVGLWKHSKLCLSKDVKKSEKMTFKGPTLEEKLLEKSEDHEKLYQQNQVKTMIEIKELSLMLVKQNAEIVELVKSLNNNQMNSNNSVNSHNKTFNIQLFLNETCKDAMNMADFIESMKVQLSDLEKV